MMKRLLLGGSALLAAALATAAITLGPELWAGYRFMTALDQHYAESAAKVGPWPQIQEACTVCHGVGGQPRDGQYAALAGLPAAYISAQLQAFASGQRPSAQMEPLAASLSAAQIDMLARYFASQPATTSEMPDPDEALVRRGQAAIAARGCASCHGETLAGGALGPRIAGQGKAYLLDQLQAFRQGHRQDPTQGMNAIAATLADDDLQAIAHYLASQAPASR